MANSLRKLNLETARSADVLALGSDWSADAQEAFEIDNSTLLYTSVIFWLKLKFAATYTSVVDEPAVDLYLLAGAPEDGTTTPWLYADDGSAAPNTGYACTFAPSAATADTTHQILQSPPLWMPADKVRGVLLNVSGETIDEETELYYRLFTDLQSEV